MDIILFFCLAVAVIVVSRDTFIVDKNAEIMSVVRNLSAVKDEYVEDASDKNSEVIDDVFGIKDTETRLSEIDNWMDE